MGIIPLIRGGLETTGVDFDGSFQLQVLPLSLIVEINENIKVKSGPDRMRCSFKKKTWIPGKACFMGRLLKLSVMP